ncbi:hypothetical protein ACHAPU_000755 [Fusarium lateritium]
MGITKNLISEIAQLAQLARNVADERLSDQEAQRRADAATSFVKERFGLSVNTKNEKSSHPPTRDSTSLRPLHLPVETCRLVFGYVADFDYKPRQKTLLALSRTCRLFKSLAEEHLYSDPRDLDDTRRQWLFLYSLVVEPTRAARVKSLRFLWRHNGDNGKLLVDIVTSCCNVRNLLIQRGSDEDEEIQISNKDMINLGAMICACPDLNSFHYSTLGVEDEDPYADDVAVTGNRIVIPLSDDAHLGQAMKHLSSISLVGRADWVLWGLFPHLSTSLTSFTLAKGSWGNRLENPFTTLSQQCPSLEYLAIDFTLASTDDFEQACKAWGPTLKMLSVQSIEEVTPWLTRLMPSMIALERLFLGPGCMIAVEDVEAIARSKIPLNLIDINDMQRIGDGVTHSELNEALVRMIEAHSSTLETLMLGQDIEVGAAVVRACRKAKQLTFLQIGPYPVPDSSDVDALLDACPNLDHFPHCFTSSSLRSKEWCARSRARGEREEEEDKRARPPEVLCTIQNDL